jgi:hypothetical protein
LARSAFFGVVAFGVVLLPFAAVFVAAGLRLVAFVAVAIVFTFLRGRKLAPGELDLAFSCEVNYDGLSWRPQ